MAGHPEESGLRLDKNIPFGEHLECIWYNFTDHLAGLITRAPNIILSCKGDLKLVIHSGYQ